MVDQGFSEGHAAVGVIDRDLLCAIGPTIVLSENDGAGTFTPVRSLRAASNAAFYGLSAADYDLDGDLDVYACRYVKTSYTDSIPIPYHDARNGPRNHLLRNEGADGFRDVTDEVGLGVNNDRFSLAPCWSDYDGDGDPDLYVANDFGGNNLYRNDNGHFVDMAPQSDVEDIGRDYPLTLNHWRRNFFQHVHEVRDMGYPQEFIWMWEFYLCYCEGGFIEGPISDVHLVAEKPL